MHICNLEMPQFVTCISGFINYWWSNQLRFYFIEPERLKI